MLMQWKTTSDPFFNDFRFLSRHVDEVFRELFPSSKTLATRPTRSSRALQVDESEDAFTVRAALPGVRAEDLSLEVLDGKLSLAVTRNIEAPEGYQTVRSERRDLSLKRTLTLGRRVDVDAVSAAFENGILTITLPKRPEEKPRAISIAAA